ncbi:hypothetical protein NHX12_030783 [Muraenolepis orangiensis]|uniref:Uncharacterized protein n=1 Tax=Muraenolepis orangiensis TaxID=630683 RepID=A0A9Q0ILE4_9TELE|nr:hypothetical protein NHX12_030783 [Muraenolepis orangiensis]
MLSITAWSAGVFSDGGFTVMWFGLWRLPRHRTPVHKSSSCVNTPAVHKQEAGSLSRLTCPLSCRFLSPAASHPA